MKAGGSRTSRRLFLSAVSSEFESYRQLLAGDLERPTLDVATQERFIVYGASTLEKLDEYIQACDGVVHRPRSPHVGAGTALPRPAGVGRFQIRNPQSEIDTALAKPRQSNNLDDLPKALLTSALYAGTLAGQPDEARRFLDEAQLIAERGPMPLYLAAAHWPAPGNPTRP
jgi:hypothetical protein